MLPTWTVFSPPYTGCNTLRNISLRSKNRSLARRLLACGSVDMLDWFLSKISVLIFIIVIAGALLFFSSMQLAVLGQAQKVQGVNSLARLIDVVCENCRVNYSFDRGYAFSIQGYNLTVDGVIRHFVSKAGPVAAVGKDLAIYRQGGVVYVKAV